MNIGMITSYLVAGIMMLSILVYTNSTFTSTAETTTSSVTQTKLDNIVTILSNDFARIGYNVPNPKITPIFLSISDTSVTFIGDIYEDGSDDPDEVEWVFTDIKYTSSTNPDDKILRRKWNGTPSVPANAQVYDFSATHFELRFLDNLGNPTSNSGDIKQVEVEILVESNEPFVKSKISSPDSYYRSVWKRKIVLNNAVYLTE